MKVLKLIDNYLDLYVRKINLESELETVQDGIINMEKQATNAYFDGRYDEEENLNARLLESTKRVGDLHREIAFVYGNLSLVEEETLEELHMLTSPELRSLLGQINERIEVTTKDLSDLEVKTRWAIHKGNIAYSKDNYSAEKEYNEIVSECNSAAATKRIHLDFYRLLKEKIELKLKSIAKKTLKD